MPQTLVDYASSLLVALIIAAVGFGLGADPHLDHAALGARQERLLLALTQRLSNGITVIPGTAEHHTAGYGDLSPDGHELACATHASVLLHVAGSSTDVTPLSGHGLPNLAVQLISPSRLRASVYVPVGESLYDWACWQ